jgi:hypothetical protein
MDPSSLIGQLNNQSQFRSERFIYRSLCFSNKWCIHRMCVRCVCMCAAVGVAQSKLWQKPLVAAAVINLTACGLEM